MGVVQTVIEEPKLSISSSKPEVDEFPVAGVAWNRTGSLPILNETGHQPAASDSPRRSTFVVKNSMPSTRIDHFKVPLKPNPESSPRRETFIVAKVKGNKSTTNHDGEPKKLTGPKTITEELVANDNAHHVESKFKEVANVSISQQEYCLTVWLNYIFKPQFLQTPDTGANVLRLFQQVVTDKGTSMTERISGTKSQQLSYQRYTEIHSYHQLRLKAKNLFDDLILVMEKVDKTIIEKKIIIRPDCKVYADVGKSKLLYFYLHFE